MTIFLGTLIVLFQLTHTYAAEKVTVGVYQNVPLCFSDKYNHAKGIYIDCLNYVAGVYQWQLHYKIDTWNNCLKDLKSHNIDLMCGIANTPERKETYFFNQETIMLDWGQIYLPRQSDIQSILDLDKKRIATVRGGILKTKLQSLANSFDISCHFVLVESAHEVLQLIDRNQVDAGTVLRLFGMRFSNQYRIKPSPIVFSPLHLCVATANPQKKHLLEKIDLQLAKLKKSDSSAYFQSIHRWLTDSEDRWFLPHRFYGILFGIAALLIFLLVVSIFFKHQVIQRTIQLNNQNIDLKQKERLLHTIADNYPNSYLTIIEKDLTVSFSSGQELKKMNLSSESLNGKHVNDIFGEHAEFITQQYQKSFSGEAQSFELFFNNQYQKYRTVPLIETDNIVSRILVIVENITLQRKNTKENKHLENQLHQAAQQNSLSNGSNENSFIN